MVKIEQCSVIYSGVPGQRQLIYAEPFQRRRQNSGDLGLLLSPESGINYFQMASLPQAAFAVHKLRKPKNEKDLTVARLSMEKQETPRYMNNQTLDLSPVKYSDKFMNSIWGLYNRYSPHNFKKNNGSDLQYFSMQQPFAVACAASEKNTSEAPSGSKK
ncbi:uncharacterized protein LOC128737572 [Sabethes cyaneus]|uniref:uncharacterized protein LOC128737572 n=1 Tax=Sabethes cyaneus TaxID=53552 RepID=UPI00221E2AD2|nr:uncharacterized protein LOC128737572 [Sabethes cyaneus]